MSTFILIDGNSLINRAFYALPPLNNKDGVPTQAVYGFINMLVKAITDYNPNYIAVAFDMRQPTFRHKMYDGYKATRKGMPEELAVQMPILKELLQIMGISYIEKGGFEADDIIGTLASSFDTDTLIITGDRDAYQLISDKTNVLMTKRGISEVVRFDEAMLLQEYQLTPKQIIDLKSLSGDTSDNIPGVGGVGDKTATTLLNTYGDLDSVYEHIDEIKGKLKEKLTLDKEKAYISRTLATIDTHVPLECKLDDFTFNFPFNIQTKQFFADNSFKTLLKRDELFDSSGILEVPAKLEKKVREIVLVESMDALSKFVGSVSSSVAVYIGDSIHLATNDETEYIVNISYSLLDNGLDYGTVMATLKPLLENAKVKKIIHNAKLVKKYIAPNKIDIINYFDTMLAQYLVDMTVSYEKVSDILLNYEMDEREIATGLFAIMQILSSSLDALSMTSLYNDIELPIVDILYDMEKNGFCIDQKRLNELGLDYAARIESLSCEIQAMAGKKFNVNSPKQLIEVLFDDMGIAYPTKSKKRSSSKEILEQIKVGNPIVEKILAYRFLNKLNSTYVEGLKKAVDPKGIVHTEFKQMLTTTGRLSSVEPNLQNIPVRTDEGKHMRGVFVASEGCTLISADYSQIELRLMAHFSADPTMIAAYQNNEDIHAATASEVFGVPLKDVTAAMRRDAKAVNFGIIYGISEYGLAQNLGIAPYKAKDYIERYFHKFGAVKAYLDDSVKLAKSRGYASTLFGRVRKIPELSSPNFNVRQFGERIAMNMPLQGSASDIIKIAMINVARKLKPLKSKLILQVHDELMIDCVLDEVNEVRAILKESMESAVSLRVPLVADVGMGKTWYDCK